MFCKWKNGFLSFGKTGKFSFIRFCQCLHLLASVHVVEALCIRTPLWIKLQRSRFAILTSLQRRGSTEPAPAEPLGSPAKQGSGWSEAFAPKLDASRVATLKKRFLEAFPSEILTAMNTPSLRLLSTAVDAEVKRNWSWIPWKSRMTQQMYEDSLMQKPAKRARIETLQLSDLLLDEPPQIDINDSTMGISMIRRLLEVHDKVPSLLQAPRILRADKHLWSCIFQLVIEKEWQVNDAIYEFTEIRGLFDSIAFCAHCGKPLGPNRFAALTSFPVTTALPELCRDLNALFRFLFPNEHWNALCVSRNGLSALHSDSANIPGSRNLSLSLGAFSGGHLWIEDLSCLAQGQPISVASGSGWLHGCAAIDTHRKAISFDGRIRHMTLPFSGERWALTAFSLPDVCCAELEFLGFPLPPLHAITANFPAELSGVLPLAELSEADITSSRFLAGTHIQEDVPPSGSASDVSADVTSRLLQEELDAGYCFKFEGTLEEAKSRWPVGLALGKLGVVRAPGRAERLVLDNSVAGTNSQCTVPERQCFPSIHDVSHSFPIRETSDRQMAICIDVKQAHKRCRIRDSEQGLLGFTWQNELESFLGLAMWACALFPTMRAMLHPFYKDLWSPAATNFSIAPESWHSICNFLDSSLRFKASPPHTAIPAGAKLLSARHVPFATLADLSKVAVTHKRLWLRVECLSSSRRKLSSASIRSLQAFERWLQHVAPLASMRPSQVADVEVFADASASGPSCSLGGFVSCPVLGQVRFAETFSVQEFEAAGIPFGNDLAKKIASCEALAQAGLIHALSRLAPCSRVPLRLPSLCDNSGAEAGLNKMFSTKHPLGLVLEHIALLAAMHRISIDVSHVPGAKNCKADALSRPAEYPTPPDCLPCQRIRFGLSALWEPRPAVQIFPSSFTLPWLR
ncbi:Gapdh [Symbiodinium sp. CCMP2592]|nr:Gapdh [Symbiodinium sp. CCMP2592]